VTVSSLSYREADASVALADVTVGQLLADRAAAYPEREALIGVSHATGEITRLTYGELYDRARRVATALARLTAPGDFVALWAPNVVEWPVVQYGAALAGVLLVALNPALRDDELHYALTHSGSKLLLHADFSARYPMGEVARRVAARVPGVHRIALSETERWIGGEPDDEMLAARAPDPDSAAMLQYTSGTTGRPKGVVLRHRSLVNVAGLTMQAVGVRDGARCLNPLPMFHTAGCVISTLGPTWAAGTVVLAERFVAGDVLDALRRERVDVLFYVPAILTALLECQRTRTGTAPQLSVMMGGASAVSGELIDDAERVFGGIVINLFGQTELAPVLSSTRPGDTRADRSMTVGRPLPHVDCKIVDAEGRVVPSGEVGEICARGYQQFVEYLHDPHATAAAVDTDGFVRTGDLGAMDERGYLTVTGRLKELIIRGGENISPAEVETLIAGHDAVEQAVVLGLPDPRLGEIVAAVICPAGAPDGLKCRLEEHLGARAAHYKVPERWFVATELPVTATGKVQRFALRDAILRGDLTEL
jgi:fatty-acyl-CoA synthase/long-chain acyl-CoA synthetase